MPHRNPRPVIQLLGNLAKIALPLLLITAVSWWVLNLDTKPVGQVHVTSSIKGADVYVDGVQSGAVTDTVLDGIEVGRRLITVRAPGLISDPEVAIVEIQAGRIGVAAFSMVDSVTASKGPEIVPLRDGVRQDIFALDEAMIRSIPAAPKRRSMLLYGDLDSDRNPEAGEKLVGQAILPLTHKDTVNALQGTANKAALERTTLTGTSISVSSEPAGGAILVNGARTPNKTPYTYRGLDRGYYVFSIELDGYIPSPDSIEIVLTENDQSELAAFSLQPVNKLPTPQLTITTVPLAAGIRVDGVAVGVGSAVVSSSYGTRVVEFAGVPGFKSPDPIRINVTADNPNHELVGTYERLSGTAMIAIVPNENFTKFDGKKLRVYVDDELILDSPEKSFDATLISRLYPGERAIKIQYGDLVAEDIVKLTSDQVAELTIRVDAMFGKSKLKFKTRTEMPLDKWQSKFKKLNVLTQS